MGDKRFFKERVTNKRVLWLASWYPNAYEPTHGDFVQRHAVALSECIKVDVIHLPQIGSNKRTQKGETKKNIGENLTERIVYFNNYPTGIVAFDKIAYNIRYTRAYNKALHEYEKEHGLPLLVHVHIPMKAGLLALSFGKLWKCPVFVSEQSSCYCKEAPDYFFKRSRFFQLSTKRVFREALAVSNVSKTIGKVIAEITGIKEVTTIHNTVNTALFNYVPKKKGLFRWIHVSSMHEQKNIKGILDAFEILSKKRKDWELVMVGPKKQPLENLVNEAGLSNNIRFTGELSYEEVSKEMKSADAFVLFSQHENFPCVIVEALCCGLMVASCDVGGVKEAINPTNGLIVGQGDVTGLSKALSQIMDGRQSYNREQIALEAKVKYSYSTIAKQFLAFYGLDEVI